MFIAQAPFRPHVEPQLKRSEGEEEEMAREQRKQTGLGRETLQAIANSLISSPQFQETAQTIVINQRQEGTQLQGGPRRGDRPTDASTVSHPYARSNEPNSRARNFGTLKRRCPHRSISATGPDQQHHSTIGQICLTLFSSHLFLFTFTSLQLRLHVRADRRFRYKHALKTFTMSDFL